MTPQQTEKEVYRLSICAWAYGWNEKQFIGKYMDFIIRQCIRETMVKPLVKNIGKELTCPYNGYRK